MSGEKSWTLSEQARQKIALPNTSTEKLGFKSLTAAPEYLLRSNVLSKSSLKDVKCIARPSLHSLRTDLVSHAPSSLSPTKPSTASHAGVKTNLTLASLNIKPASLSVTSPLIYSSSTKTSLSLTNARSSSLLTSSFSSSLTAVSGIKSSSLLSHASLSRVQSSLLQSRLTGNVPKHGARAVVTAGKKAERVLPSDMEVPAYSLASDDWQQDSSAPVNLFTPPEKDPALLKISRPVHDIETIKVCSHPSANPRH